LVIKRDTDLLCYWPAAFVEIAVSVAPPAQPTLVICGDMTVSSEVKQNVPGYSSVIVAFPIILHLPYESVAKLFSISNVWHTLSYPEAEAIVYSQVLIFPFLSRHANSIMRTPKKVANLPTTTAPGLNVVHRPLLYTE